jgi:hypothetical protein
LQFSAGRKPFFLATFVEETVFSPLYGFGTFVENKMRVVALIHTQVLYSVPLVFISVFVPVPCCFHCYGSVVYFEVGYCDISNTALFAQFCLVFSWYLVYPNEP